MFRQKSMGYLAKYNFLAPPKPVALASAPASASASTQRPVSTLSKNLLTSTYNHQSQFLTLASIIPNNPTNTVTSSTPINHPIIIQTPSRPFTTSPKMYQPPTTAEEDTYTNFLLNANRDYSSPTAASPGGSITAKSKSHIDLSKLPTDISTLHNTRFYTSDIDAPFKAVELALPTTPHTQASIESGIYRYTVARALDIDEEVIKKLGIGEWDPRGEYRDVVEAVEKWVREGNKESLGLREVDSTREGEVAVFAVEGEGVRVEYFIVGVVKGGEDKPDRVVGMKVLAVES